MKPSTRPKLSVEDATERITFAVQKYGHRDRLRPVVILGTRGHYKGSMGNPLKNDRGIYDDAHFLIARDGSHFSSWNANVDPSVFRPGIATLVPGIYLYKLGIHGLSKPKPQRYRALVQAAEVTVSRDGQKDLDTGYFGINIHRGGYQTTSSAGCQTIYPDQWPAFFGTVEMEMARHGIHEVTYVLADG